MPRNLRAALGLSLLTVLALSAMSVMSASATSPGAANHFTTSTTNTKYTVTENTGSAHQMQITGYNTTVVCHNPQYSVHHTSTTTFTSLMVTPVNSTNWNCTDNFMEPVTVHINGCYYQFTAKASGATHATVHFICPTIKAEVTTSNGSLLKVGSQTPKGGATYTSINGEVTANITAEGIHGECHGICEIFGGGTTTSSVKISGSATIAAFNTVTGAKAHLTAT